jgi:diguanylate cyclase
VKHQRSLCSPGAGQLQRARAPLTSVLRWLLVAWCLLVGSMAQAAISGAPVVLDDRTPQVDLWPQASVMHDATKQLKIADVMGAAGRFEAPTTAERTLGLRRDAVWLKLPFSTSANTNGMWVFDIDYSQLNRVEAYLVRDGAIDAQHLMGNLVPKEQRTVNSRVPSAGLYLAPQTSYTLYVRVENYGAMIVPVALSKPAAYLERELAEQMLQGVLFGLGLCLLIYSLGQWFTLGEHLFVKYALLISGSILFNVLHFGIGRLYLWPGNTWMELHVGGLSALLASTGSFLFVEQVLRGADMGKKLSAAMWGGAAINLVTAVIFALDWIGPDHVTMVVSTVGLLPPLLGAPGAIRRARRGDVIGVYFLVAWLVYFGTTYVLIEVIKGQLAANFWTMHSFQIGATIDMLIFMRVLGLQTRAVKLAAQQVKLERDTLHSMAHTDPLTGLPNRRILNSAITNALAQRAPDDLLAVYMLDLDGFKQVNDKHGHDLGDELLIAVATRLKSSLRSSDIITRLGGDEFLVLSSGLKTVAQAQELGEKLVKSISEPFLLSSQVCHVGLTVGYALAPQDGVEVRGLLNQADAAMYAAKQAGKGRTFRAKPVVDLAASAQPAPASA